MVTTRRGTETPGMASTPASSAKKAVGKRELDALDTPTQVKRQRKTTVELKRTLRSTPRKGGDEPAEEAVDDDTADATPRPEKASPLAMRRRSSPRVVVEPSSPARAQDGFHTPEPASSEAAFVTPYTSKKALEGSPTPKPTKSTTPKPAKAKSATPATPATPAAAKKARGRPRKTPKDDAPDEMPSSKEIPSSTQESSPASPALAPPTAHVRFGSEEPTVNAKGHTRYEAPALAPAQENDDDDDDNSDSGDDSDEAPEMLTTSAAASKAAAAHADTSRALAAQSAKERKKREAREHRIADEQAAKRARDALKAQKAAAKAKKAARLPEPTEDATPPPTATATATAIDRTALPSLLPDSLLAHLDPVRPPTPPPSTHGPSDDQRRRAKLNHHIKFLEHTGKAPKDKRVGRHHVAVLAQQNSRLPPKVARNGKGVREAWLKGRRGEGVRGKPKGGKTQRAKFGGGGFLRGE